MVGIQPFPWLVRHFTIHPLRHGGGRHEGAGRRLRWSCSGHYLAFLPLSFRTKSVFTSVSVRRDIIRHDDVAAPAS